MATYNYAVIGFFGFRDNQPCGQTIKTRCFSDALENIDESSVYRVDTGDIKTKPFHTLMKVIYAFFCSKRIFISPNINGLRYLLPFYHVLSKITQVKVDYIVIGGWLYPFLNKNKSILKHLHFLNAIHVETDQMVDDLSKIPELKIKHLPNFRSFTTGSFSKKTATRELKCLFLARVRHDKGVEICIDAVSTLIDKGSHISLGIYGPIQEDYRENFLSKIQDSDDKITYNGSIDPFDTDFYNKISQYDLLLLPTFYEGEGFPGTFLDAFITGLPIIASDWKYNSKLVEDGKTGLIIKAKDTQSLINSLSYLKENPDIYSYLSHNAIQESYKYHAESLIQEIL